ncbi:hypothetical protein NESM_000283000 [Novymonas esmeraldas]|uniref:Uncharacterized protein n=1 Tax=Novymonas esmeraldas TaxID=1808958 RepID=A0AAW0F7B0_9TRYP
MSLYDYNFDYTDTGHYDSGEGSPASVHASGASGWPADAAGGHTSTSTPTAATLCGRLGADDVHRRSPQPCALLAAAPRSSATASPPPASTLLHDGEGDYLTVDEVWGACMTDSATGHPSRVVVSDAAAATGYWYGSFSSRSGASPAPQRRGSESGCGAVRATAEETHRVDTDDAGVTTTAAESASAVEDEQLGGFYFDGMLSMMLQCGEAMLAARARRETLRVERRREALLNMVRSSARSTAPEEEEDNRHDDGGTAAAAAASSINVETATEAQLLRLLGAADVSELGVVSDSSSSDDDVDDYDDVFKSNNVSSGGASSTSSSLRQTEALTAALDGFQRAVRGTTTLSRAAEVLTVSDDKTASSRSGSCSRSPSEAAEVLSAATGVRPYMFPSSLGESFAESILSSESERLRQTVAMPRLTPATLTSLHLNYGAAKAAAAAAAAAAPPPPAVAAPLPHWVAPAPPLLQSQRGASTARPRLRADKERHRSRRGVYVAMAAAPGSPAVPLQPVTAAASPLRDVSNAGGADSCYSPLRQPPPTVAEMLRASTAPAHRVPPLTLLLTDGDAAPAMNGASLSHQRQRRGDRAGVQSCGGTPGGSSSHAAGPRGSGDVACVDESDWRVMERVTVVPAPQPTTSRTVRHMAEMVASGYSVSLVSLHSSGAPPSSFTAWGAVLPEFFTAYFRCLRERTIAARAVSTKLSVALVKCDLYRDLLSDVTRFTPVTVLGTPLLGVRLARLSTVAVSTLSGCVSALHEAHGRLSRDDYANGGLVVTVTVKQQEMDEVTGEQRDVLLSSFTMFASTPEVCADAMEAERLPATGGLLLQLFRGPVQSAVSVSTCHMRESAAEMLRALAVQRVLRGRDTLPPRPGSISACLAHIRVERRYLASVLEASKACAVGRRRTLMEEAVARRMSAMAATAAHAERVGRRPPAPSTRAALTWEDKAYASERRQRTRLRYALRALACLDNDCKDALAAPVSTLPPMYLLTQRSSTGSHCSSSIHVNGGAGGVVDRGDGVEEPRRASDGDALDKVSEDSDRAAEEALRRCSGLEPRRMAEKERRKAGKGRHGKDSSAAALAAVAAWRATAPEACLFAGDAACCTGGVQPLFRVADPWLASAFNPVSHGNAAAAAAVAESRAVETVVYLEEHNHGGAGATTAAAATPCCIVNGRALGCASAAPPADVARFTVDELCVVRGGGGATSTAVRSAFSDFVEGQNVSIWSVAAAGGGGCVVTRMMRSPLWAAMRDMVERALPNSAAAAAAPTGPTAAAHGGTSALYMSVTQPLSIYGVKDHLCRTSGAALSFGGGPPSTGVDSARLSHGAAPGAGTDGVMDFRAAWTPAGPVVAGARYVPITSVAQFRRATRDLPAHVQRVACEQGTERHGGTHVLVSFLLRRVTPPPTPPRSAAGRATATSLSSDDSVFASSSHGDATAPLDTVYFTAATVLLSTTPLFWSSLHRHDYVPPQHPLNVLRPTYRHRVLSVVDVAATALDCAATLLAAQQSVTQHARFTAWRVPWCMQSYATYLARHRDALKWCIDNLVASSGAEASTDYGDQAMASPLSASNGAAAAQRFYVDLTGRDLPPWVRQVLAGRRVSLGRVATAWRQVGLMHSIAADLVLGGDTPQSPWSPSGGGGGACVHPSALMDGTVLYDVTAPPRLRTHALLDVLLSANAAAGAVEKEDSGPAVPIAASGDKDKTASPRGSSGNGVRATTPASSCSMPSPALLRTAGHVMTLQRLNRERAAAAAAATTAAVAAAPAAAAAAPAAAAPSAAPSAAAAPSAVGAASGARCPPTQFLHSLSTDLDGNGGVRVSGAGETAPAADTDVVVTAAPPTQGRVPVRPLVCVSGHGCPVTSTPTTFSSASPTLLPGGDASRRGGGRRFSRPASAEPLSSNVALHHTGAWSSTLLPSPTVTSAHVGGAAQRGSPPLVEETPLSRNRPPPPPQQSAPPPPLPQVPAPLPQAPPRSHLATLAMPAPRILPQHPRLPGDSSLSSTQLPGICSPARVPSSPVQPPPATRESSLGPPSSSLHRTQTTSPRVSADALHRLTTSSPHRAVRTPPLCKPASQHRRYSAPHDSNEVGTLPPPHVGQPRTVQGSVP